MSGATHLAIYDGQTLMGAVVDNGTNCQAKDADGKSLGKFDDRKAAIQAVDIHYSSKRIKRPRAAN